MIREKLDLGRQRFSDQESRLSDMRARSAKKVTDYHKKIDAQVAARNQRTFGKTVFQSTLNRSRAEENIDNNKFQKYQLDCIKERVKRKYVKTSRRRAI